MYRMALFVECNDVVIGMRDGVRRLVMAFLLRLGQLGSFAMLRHSGDQRPISGIIVPWDGGLLIAFHRDQCAVQRHRVFVP